MRWKYQLRGLGLGLVLATLIMGIGQNKNENVVAKPTATVESESTMEDSSSLEEVIEEVSVAEEISSVEEASESQVEEPVSEEAVSSEEGVSEETKEPEEPEYSVVVIEIRSGEGSGTVSRRLEEAGLVEDAAAYDKYLCQNGYDKKIRVGLHEINADATDEEIAKAITSRK